MTSRFSFFQSFFLALASKARSRPSLETLQISPGTRFFEMRFGSARETSINERDCCCVTNCNCWAISGSSGWAGGGGCATGAGGGGPGGGAGCETNGVWLAGVAARTPPLCLIMTSANANSRCVSGTRETTWAHSATAPNARCSSMPFSVSTSRGDTPARPTRLMICAPMVRGRSFNCSGSGASAGHGGGAGGAICGGGGA
mmetsp:Transcript_14225/g.37665  ORF Transcript_14225/g.37665 Transcript_14225/m.37665 type:complete len:201 (-) Transcript_14225:319-921(-)